MKNSMLAFVLVLTSMSFASSSSACGLYGLDDYHKANGFRWAAYKADELTSKLKATSSGDDQTRVSQSLTQSSTKRQKPVFSSVAGLAAMQAKSKFKSRVSDKDITQTRKTSRLKPEALAASLSTEK